MHEERTVLTVSELNSEVARLLDSEFGWISVEGELSNLATPASGHIYFTLKDDSAQVRCAMFRASKRGLRFAPANGDHVVVRCRVSLYEVRGDYQLIIDRMEQAGDGALQRKFEELKMKLDAEGLFSDAAKQAIPELPACIGVITSRSGAAIQDVLSVIGRRFPSLPVKLFPVAVQGAEAAPAICRALKLAGQYAACDVLLLVRGGGSLEDLWSFNEESVARAIFDCPIPVVSGVGHEVDITIADFVADFRAATPTAAAEKVTPDQRAWMQTMDWYQSRLQQLVQERIRYLAERLHWLRQRLSQQHPLTQLQRLHQRLRELDQRLKQVNAYQLSAAANRLAMLRNRLHAQSPATSIRTGRIMLANAARQLQLQMQASLKAKRSSLAQLAGALHAYSPLQTLGRGYSITSLPDGQTLTDADRVRESDRIVTRLHHGQLLSKVEKITRNTNS